MRIVKCLLVVALVAVVAPALGGCCWDPVRGSCCTPCGCDAPAPATSAPTDAGGSGASGGT